MPSVPFLIWRNGTYGETICIRSFSPSRRHESSLGTWYIGCPSVLNHTGRRFSWIGSKILWVLQSEQTTSVDQEAIHKLIATLLQQWQWLKLMSLVSISNSLVIACFSELEQHFRVIGRQLLVENKLSCSEKLEGELLLLFVSLHFFQVCHPWFELLFVSSS
jgi:hypothetical protein